MSLPVYHHPLRVVLLLYSVLFLILKKSLTSKSRIIKRDSGNGSQRLKDEEEEDGIEDCYKRGGRNSSLAKREGR